MLGFVCNHASLCPACNRMCEVDDLAFPVFKHLLRGKVDECSSRAQGRPEETTLGEDSSSSNPRVWLHLECADRLGLATKEASGTCVCKHWRRKGLCLFQETCHFSHPEHLCGVDREKFFNQRSWGGRRRKVRNTGRAWVLIKFVLETFGVETLQQGAGVLDVAGGLGQVGFQLLNLCGVETAVVDPRKPNLVSCVRKFEKGMMHRNRASEAFITRSRNDGMLQLGWIQLYVDQPLLDATLAHHAANNAVTSDKKDLKGLENIELAPLLQSVKARLQQALEEASRLSWDSKGLHQGDAEQDDNPYKSLAENSVKIFSDVDEILQKFSQCSCLVGMHPDQATEFIVDLALALNKPFAVVPCCVYSNLFPKRVGPTGSPIRSYDDFCDFLQAKDPSIKRATLAFDGRNTVLFRAVQ